MKAASRRPWLRVLGWLTNAPSAPRSLTRGFSETRAAAYSSAVVWRVQCMVATRPSASVAQRGQAAISEGTLRETERLVRSCPAGRCSWYLAPEAPGVGAVGRDGCGRLGGGTSPTCSCLAPLTGRCRLYRTFDAPVKGAVAGGGIGRLGGGGGPFFLGFLFLLDLTRVLVAA